MNDLADKLESLDDGQNVEVSLSRGDVFVLCDFELVDESIYDRADLIVARTVEVKSSSFRYTVETLIELALGDITRVTDCVSGLTLFNETTN